MKGSTLDLTVNHCENLGQTTLVHGSLAGHRTTAKFREWSNYEKGAKVGVSFTKKHFFDKETTMAIK